MKLTQNENNCLSNPYILKPDRISITLTFFLVILNYILKLICYNITYFMANDLNSTKCQKSFHFMILQFYPLRYKIYYNESYVPSVVKCASVVDVSLLCFVEWITVYMWLWKKKERELLRGGISYIFMITKRKINSFSCSFQLMWSAYVKTLKWNDVSLTEPQTSGFMRIVYDTFLMLLPPINI